MKAVVVDGFLAVMVAVCGFSIGYFESDETFKYVHAVLRYWLVYAFGVLNAGFAALLFFRGKSYAEHIQKTAGILTQQQKQQAVINKINENVK